MQRFEGLEEAEFVALARAVHAACEDEEAAGKLPGFSIAGLEELKVEGYEKGLGTLYAPMALMSGRAKGLLLCMGLGSLLQLKAV